MSSLLPVNIQIAISKDSAAHRTYAYQMCIRDRPDNDFRVYLPVRDMWRKDTKNWLMQFDIHSMAKRAPEFIKVILDSDKAKVMMGTGVYETTIKLSKDCLLSTSNRY